MNWFDLLISWAVRSSDMLVHRRDAGDHRQRLQELLDVLRAAEHLLALGVGPIVFGPLQIFPARGVIWK